MSVLFSVGSQRWAQRPAHSWPSAVLVSRWMGLLRTWSEMKQKKDWVEMNALQGHVGSGSRILKAQNIPPCLGARGASVEDKGSGFKSCLRHPLSVTLGKLLLSFEPQSPQL